MRVWAPVQQLGTGEGEDLVEVLVRARLLSRDNGVVAVAHESIARFWPRLQGWLEDDIEGRRILRHLTDAADSWEALGRVDSELYRGVRLSRALEWQASSGTSLTPWRRSTSRHRDGRPTRNTAVRRSRHADSVARPAGSEACSRRPEPSSWSSPLRRRSGSASVTWPPTRPWPRRSMPSLAVANEASDPAVAALAGVEAVRLRDDAESRAALHQALDRWPALLASVEVPGAVSLSVGETEPSSSVTPWEAHRPRPAFAGRGLHGQRTCPAGPRSSTAVARLLVGTRESEVFLVDLSTGRRESLLASAPGEIDRVAASANGWVRAAEHFDWRDGTSTVHVVARAVPVRTLPPLALAGFALTPDGSKVLVRLRTPTALSVVDVAVRSAARHRHGSRAGAGEPSGGRVAGPDGGEPGRAARRRGRRRGRGRPRRDHAGGEVAGRRTRAGSL